MVLFPTFSQFNVKQGLNIYSPFQIKKATMKNTKWSNIQLC